MEDLRHWLIAAVQRCPFLDFPSYSMAVALLGYLSILAAMELILPAKIVAGAILPDKSRIFYKCNGWTSLLVLLIFFSIGAKLDFFPLTVVADNVGALLSTTLVFSLLVSLALYMAGCRSNSQCASLKAYVTGNIIHDWWFGVQLNPHLLVIDIKFFCIKAGMIGWLLLNLSILFNQLQHNGALTLSMILYQAFSMVYILDFFWFEELMTSTWDIIAERFGFMLVFGDLVWIPFTFSIQGWWLLRHKVEVTKLAVLLNILIFLIGYAVFRGANKQKHDFKKDPSCLIWGHAPIVIGGKLLASGYWGVARHSNYLGDILVAFSFSLPCGASSLVPYFYPTYLFLLLLWRERRDEARCSEKYKEDWSEYCKIVPWRIFPYIY